MCLVFKAVFRLFSSRKIIWGCIFLLIEPPTAGTSKDGSYATVGPHRYRCTWIGTNCVTTGPSCPSLPSCATTATQLHHDGYIYRTLAGAVVEGKRFDVNEEYTYFPMPAGFEVAPDGGEVQSVVIKEHPWDNWRICTQTRCYAGGLYAQWNSAGVDRTDQDLESPAWETNANGEHRLKHHVHNGKVYHWCRLLLRSPCA